MKPDPVNVAIAYILGQMYRNEGQGSCDLFIVPGNLERKAFDIAVGKLVGQGDMEIRGSRLLWKQNN